MKGWMLANQTEKVGRLYWSSLRGWTYKELATIYVNKECRETYTPPHMGTEVVWLRADCTGFGVTVEEPRPLPPPMRLVREPDAIINGYRDRGYSFITYGRAHDPAASRQIAAYNCDRLALRVKVYLKARR